jgi:hypothetical protein
LILVNGNALQDMNRSDTDAVPCNQPAGYGNENAAATAIYNLTKLFSILRI